ncbi:hypothetical protein SAMN05421720_10713 [Rhodospira trueperi]|uniref:Uncharacterized protein n=1 Tax=Rhodospira trueperi TaxID=69960 RepID=A0A1G7D2Z9_9PROT|nr:hypothetical protein SAMN05421720_10713 [Rhodospira trueperi]
MGRLTCRPPMNRDRDLMGRIVDTIQAVYKAEG